MSSDPIKEAVCFTAGPEGPAFFTEGPVGVAFGAGVIHAWLAADRTAPAVVAGISTGSLTAAAMQRAMMEREASVAGNIPGKRWAWFQGYLTDMLDRPLDVIWKAFPDPVDFFSPTMPVRDLSCPEELRKEERDFRYHFWKLTKIGTWIASLPISIGDVSSLAILLVRLKEDIPIPVLGMGWSAGLYRRLTFLLTLASIAVKVVHVALWQPAFTRTAKRFVYDELRQQAFGHKKKLSPEEEANFQRELKTQAVEDARFRLPLQPLFGWRLWGLALAIEALLVAVPLAVLLYLFGVGTAANWILGVVIPLTAWGIIVAVRKTRANQLRAKLNSIAQRINDDGSIRPESSSDELAASVLHAAGIDLNLISDYQLKRRLWNRFEDSANPKRLEVQCADHGKTSLVIVAAVLQKLAGTNQQAWARSGSPLVNALAAACAMQRLFPPTHIKADQAWMWLPNATQDFDLIDGAAVRKNPLPSLFNWLKENPQVAKSMVSASRSDPAIHVIYGVPIEPFDANQGKPIPDRIDLVDSAKVGIMMRVRRDTQIEVKQTNYLSKIIAAESHFGNTGDPKHFAIFADEIAPERELQFKNPISPTRVEGLKVVAEGCRRTLGRFYAKELEEAPKGNGFVPCEDLLRIIAPHPAARVYEAGLPEVCTNCTRQLSPYRAPRRGPDIVKEDFGLLPGRHLKDELPHLCNSGKPKIVFVASGGVFSGAFHIGLIGAMQAINIVPDLVVGASVGILMGGALAAIRNSRREDTQFRLLAQLTDTFIRVDEKVALTVPLKTAVKQLGLRSRNLKLSPARLRAIVRAGTAEDPGYAATGVPPLVIDTLSQLFIIPPSETEKVGADFLAGRFAQAASRLISLVRENALDSLDIRYAVIGTSLLEGAARKLLEGDEFDLNQHQPYARKHGRTAIFSTTAYVNQRWLLVLGRDALISHAHAFSFLHAALSSSAFPAAFPVRQEREVFPGTGLVTNLFCDGGTFDNLPFMPTIELLRRTQEEHFRQSTLSPLQFLQQRLHEPDLIISAGFDPAPLEDRRPRFESQGDIADRANQLGSSAKTDSFISMSERVAEHLRALAQQVEKSTGTWDDGINRVMTGSVVAGVLNVVPSTVLHVNPAFAFARSVGLDTDRVSASISNGCFQTLVGLHGAWLEETDLGRSVRALKIHVSLGSEGENRGACPYFRVVCSFARAADEMDHTAKAMAPGARKEETLGQAKACRDVYKSCCADPVHQKLFQIAMEKRAPEHPMARTANSAV